MNAQGGASTWKVSRYTGAIRIAIALIASSATGDERASMTLEQAVSVADHIVAGEVQSFDPPDVRERPRGEPGRWTRTDAMFEVTEVLKGRMKPGGVIRVVHMREPRWMLDKARDIPEHPAGSLWFLLTRERGTYAIVGSVLRDTPELRREIDELERTRNGFTPLFVARRAEEVTRLVREGVDVDRQDHFGATALLWAAENDRRGVVRALLDHGARTDLLDRGGQNALDVAFHLGRSEVADILRGANARAHGILIHDKPLELLDAFLAQGANVNAKGRYGNTPLNAALWKFNLEGLERHKRALTKFHPMDRQIARVRWLLEHEASPSYPDGVEQQPVHRAMAYCEVDWLPVLRLLLAAGANLNAAERDRDPVLNTPVLCGNTEVVRWLLANGADANPVDRCGLTPLADRLAELNSDMVRALLAGGMELKPMRGDDSHLPYCRDRLDARRRWLSQCLPDGCGGLVDVFAEFGVDATAALAN